ncbi:MAG: 2-oxoacid:acceptor oxidoreductase family protein [Candidatus Delongbacteria bacterium]|nr:2-oxoacid:acceptor oxidoreductase family protein [Candidatus Delongbacteria bacterium]MCG2761457.1 2-oxoacid:acceptor oxidoreductase family protein [Candidatus Delongbacteria bacterium]
MKCDHYEARFAGVGGQGVILAGKILAYGMVSFEDCKAIETPTYTAQVRGGATKVDVVIDKYHIEYPRSEWLDFFLCLHQKSFNIYFKELKDDAIVVVDPNLTPNIPDNIPQKLVLVDLIDIAKQEMGKTLYAAVIAVGMFTGLTKIIKESNIQKAVLDNAPKGTEINNLKAVKLGIELGKKAFACKEKVVRLTLEDAKMLNNEDQA